MPRIRPLAGLLALAGLLGPLAASGPAQHVIYSPSPAPVVVTQPAPVVLAPTQSYVARPTRRELRRANQYNTMRPTYGNRRAVTFAPYSDRYFPTANNPPPPVATYYAAPAQPTYYMVRPR